jgi:preprotein translocase subunit SecD
MIVTRTLFLRRMLGAAMLCLSVASAPAALALDLSISSAHPGHEQRTGRPMVMLTLNDQSKRDFASFSTDNIGQKAELKIDGKVVAKPIIREPITGGVLEINGGGSDWTDEVVRDIASRLSNFGSKVEVVIVR